MDKSSQRKIGIVLSYIDMALRIAISLIYTPLMLNLLGQSEYGLFSLSSSTISYLSLITLGMGGAYTRYYIRYKVHNDEEGIKRLNGMYLIFYLAASAIALLAGLILIIKSDSIFLSLTPSEIGTTKILMSLLIFNLAFSFLSSVFSSFIGANEHFFVQRLLSITRTVVSPLVVLPILIMGYGSVGYTLATVIVNFCIEIAYISYALGKLKMKFSFRKFNFPLFKEIFIFSFFILLNQIIDQVNNNVGNFLLGVFQGSLAVAVYGVSHSIAGYFTAFSTAISSVYAPRVNELVASNADKREITKLMTRVGRVQFIILALILSGLIIFGLPFVTLWAGENYRDAYYIILLICCPVMIPLIQNVGIEIQRAMNKHQIRSIVYLVMAVINVAVSIPFIIRFGAIGAAIGTCLSYVAGNILFMNFYYHKGLHLDMIYFWKEIAKFIPALILPIGFGLFIAISDINLYSWRSLLLWIVLYTMVYCLSMWFIGMNKEEKNIIYRIINRFGIKHKLNN